MKSKWTTGLVIVFILSLFTGCGANDMPQDANESPSGSVGQPAATGTAPSASESPQQNEGSQQEDAAAAPSGFVFTVKGFTVQMGEAAASVVEALGEPVNYFEAPSCAFDGLDKIYCYSGFEIYTFPIDDIDFISSINLTDDSVSTSERVYLGMTFENMTDIYGEDYVQSFGQYTYSLDDSTLAFLIEDGVIVAITYNYVTPD